MNSSIQPKDTVSIDELAPNLRNIVVCAVWFGCSVPLLCLLFWSSTVENRKKPLFIANVVTLSIGIVLGLLNVILLVQSLLHPSTNIDKSAQLAFTTFMALIGEFIDSVLIFRVVVVFPWSTTQRALWLAIFLPLAALKAGRLANIITFIVIYHRKAQDVTTLNQFGDICLSMPEPIAVWILQIIDNAACSFIFLWWLHKTQSFSERLGGGDDGKASFAQRLRTLFWIALSNYVFPAIFTLAMLIIYIVEKDYQKTFILMTTNIYVEIFGVLLLPKVHQQPPKQLFLVQFTSPYMCTQPALFHQVGKNQERQLR
ncbi:hypothetical protein FB446DRAFT_823924 [Lentinula raphanica]|nr:hypothetical protein FB446DRAFT_823924 [Lentinula raphanica]